MEKWIRINGEIFQLRGIVHISKIIKSSSGFYFDILLSTGNQKRLEFFSKHEAEVALIDLIRSKNE